MSPPTPSDRNTPMPFITTEKHFRLKYHPTGIRFRYIHAQQDPSTLHLGDAIRSPHIQCECMSKTLGIRRKSLTHVCCQKTEKFRTQLSYENKKIRFSVKYLSFESLVLGFRIELLLVYMAKAHRWNRNRIQRNVFSIPDTPVTSLPVLFYFYLAICDEHTGNTIARCQCSLVCRRHRKRVVFTLILFYLINSLWVLWSV